MTFRTDVVCANESDVEQKVLLPLLTDLLGYSVEEIRTKSHIAPTQIDKGAGKKIGYYPDYIVYLGGLPILVVEAKDPKVTVETGFKEARLYSAELNKLFPPEINPVSKILSCNGVELLYGQWDSEGSAVKLKIKELVPGSTAVEELRAFAHRQYVLERAKEIRSKLLPVKRVRPLSLLGGPSRQNESVPSNSFSVELIPLLRRYFDPDAATYSEEILRRGYVSSEETTKYNAELEALLKERLPKTSSADSLTTSKNRAESIGSALKRAIANKKEVPDPLIILLGGVGTGKSIFIQRYFGYLIPPELSESLVHAVINFNAASSDLPNIEDWVCEELVNTLEQRFGEDFLAYENLRRYFAPDLARLERGALKPLKDSDSPRYVEEMTKELLALSKNPQKLAFGIARFFSRDCDRPFVVVFDNVDRRDRDQQLRIFQAVQWFKAQARCFCIVTMRDETFDAHQGQPPLDAFLKPFAFRVTAPRFIDVVKRRLELALEHLLTVADKKQQYELPNGMRITYPASKLGAYLARIYISLFNPSRKIRLVLEAVAGRNVRRALEMFSEIILSGYLADDKIFALTQGHGRDIPEWLVIRVLMRTNRRFYSSRHGYLRNIFDLPDDSKTANNFLTAELLDALARRRKEVSSLGIEGYQYVPAVIEQLSHFGYTKEDALWALEQLLQGGLISADHQRERGIKETDYVRITASGYFHVRFLSTRTEYLANVVIDTPINISSIARRISHVIEDSKNHVVQRLTLFRDYLAVETSRFASAFPEVAPQFLTPQFTSQRLEKALAVAKGTAQQGPDADAETLEMFKMPGAPILKGD